MDDSNEEFEPLFDYRRVQPTNFISLDDDSDSSPAFAPKRRKTSNPDTSNGKEDDKVNKGKTVDIVDCDDEEDWLPPPPKNVEPAFSKLEEDSTIKELRLKKQALASLAKSTEDALRAVDEASKKAATTLFDSFPQQDAEEPPKPAADRAKIIISIQDKTETKQYRVFADERFEQLFKKYAEKAKIDVKKLVFCFDGDKIDPTSTPQGLEMEDDDLIEVHVKPS